MLANRHALLMNSIDVRVIKKDVTEQFKTKQMYCFVDHKNCWNLMFVLGINCWTHRHTSEFLRNKLV